MPDKYSNDKGHYSEGGNMFDLDKLADMLNDAINNPESSEVKLIKINSELDAAAAHAVLKGQGYFRNITAQGISELEERQPNHPIPRLFWTTRSLMTAQVYGLAASKLAYWNKI